LCKTIQKVQFCCKFPIVTHTIIYVTQIIMYSKEIAENNYILFKLLTNNGPNVLVSCSVQAAVQKRSTWDWNFKINKTSLSIIWDRSRQLWKVLFFSGRRTAHGRPLWPKLKAPRSLLDQTNTNRPVVAFSLVTSEKLPLSRRKQVKSQDEQRLFDFCSFQSQTRRTVDLESRCRKRGASSESSDESLGWVHVRERRDLSASQRNEKLG